MSTISIYDAIAAIDSAKQRDQSFANFLSSNDEKAVKERIRKYYNEQSSHAGSSVVSDADIDAAFNSLRVDRYKFIDTTSMASSSKQFLLSSIVSITEHFSVIKRSIILLVIGLVIAAIGTKIVAVGMERSHAAEVAHDNEVATKALTEYPSFKSAQEFPLGKSIIKEYIETAKSIQEAAAKNELLPEQMEVLKALKDKLKKVDMYAERLPTFSTIAGNHPAELFGLLTAYTQELNSTTASSVDKLATLKSVFDTQIARLSQINAMQPRFESLGKLRPIFESDKSALSVFDSYMNVTKSAMGKPDPVKFNALADQVQALTNFFQAPAKLLIYTGDKSKSGIERTENNSKAARWYLIAEWTDAAGNPIPVIIQNRESTATTLTTLFGIEVTKEVYNAVKKDKTDDGIIDNRLIATKDANSLDMINVMDASPNFITQW